MSDADYKIDRVLNPQRGDKFAFDHGAIRVDDVIDGQVYFVRFRGEQDGEAVRMEIDVWREAVKRYLTRNDQPTMTCPRCGYEMEDFDGVGVMAHVAPMPEACGYCRHPSRDGDGKGNMVCGICGAVNP